MHRSIFLNVLALALRARRCGFLPLSVSILGLVACGGGDSQSSSSSGGGGSGGAGTTTSIATTSVVTVTTSSTGGSGPVRDPGKPSSHYPAFRPSMPQVITGNGPLLRAPNIYPIFFAGDDTGLDAQAEQFVSEFGSTQYWSAIASPYGVGAATGHPGIYLTDMAPTEIDDSGVQAFLAAKMNASDPMFPVPDDNTLLAVFYPAETVITQGGSLSCVSFGGYHNALRLANGQSVAYAVIPRCSDFDGFDGIDAVTAAGSHEFIEASTDPFPQQNPAYVETDQDHLYWTIALGGGEVGDMCAQTVANFTRFDELPFIVQRSWSNQSAEAYHNPCVPIPQGEVYFNTSPVLPDLIDLGQFGMMHGVKIPVGMTKVVELDLWSDGDTGGPWQVVAHDASFLMEGNSGSLSFGLDREFGQNGEKLYLSITVDQASPYNAEVFEVHSRLNEQEYVWVGFVGN